MRMYNQFVKESFLVTEMSLRRREKIRSRTIQKIHHSPTRERHDTPPSFIVSTRESNKNRAGCQSTLASSLYIDSVAYIFQKLFSIISLIMTVPRWQILFFAFTFIAATNIGCVRAFSILQQPHRGTTRSHRRWNDLQQPIPRRRRSGSCTDGTNDGLWLLFSSFASDSSEYAADRGSTDDGDEDSMAGNIYRSDQEGEIDNNNDEDETPTIELQPVPISKNCGNRFVAIVWDRKHRQRKKQNKQQQQEDDNDEDVWDWHEQRVEHTEDHVLFCRKQNLYNETFNTESMVDVLWSLQM
jgi:hypothetical protein